MAERYLLVDDSTGKYKRGPAAPNSAPFIDQDFSVGGGGQSTFIITQTFTAQSLIDVFINGVLQREGALYSFQRDVPNNEVDFNSVVPENAWVRVRVHL